MVKVLILLAILFSFSTMKGFAQKLLLTGVVKNAENGETLPSASITVKVYRINKEYYDLYENLEQDSRDLNKPPTNIKKGLGIFSAFHSQNVYFEEKKK